MAYAGETLIAAAFNDYIYSSIDGGTSWKPIGRKGSWTSLASSDDGRKVVAVEANGQATAIYSLPSLMTTPGINGSITGDGSAGIELRYLGNGAFNIVSRELVGSEGSLTFK